jgi:hypothetical protein
VGPSTMKNVLGALEILPERLIDDLGDGQAVQICLASNRLDPVALDMEGNPLRPFQRVPGG